MGILGLTHSSDGQEIQRLPVVVKIAVGRPPDPKKGRKAPEKSDHFLFQTRSTASETGWDEDEKLTKQMVEMYGANPREIEIAFLDDDIENVFPTQLAWWSQTECKCWSELVQVEGCLVMQATRRTERAPQGEAWPGTYKYTKGEKQGHPVESCGDDCPDLIEGRCKPSANLYFVLPKMPVLGATWKFHTTSYQSIRNISSSLQQIRRLTGGRLAGIPFRLCVAPQKISYRDDNNAAHKTTAPIVNIQFRAEDLQKLMSSAGEYARLFEQSRKALGPAKVVVVENEADQAAEVAPEFYPENNTPHGIEPQPAVRPEPAEPAVAAEPQRVNGGNRPGPMAPVPPAIPQSVQEGAIRTQISELCEQLDINRAGEMSLLGQFKGRLPELIEELQKRKASKAGVQAQPASSSPKTESKPSSAPPSQPKGAAASKSFEF